MDNEPPRGHSSSYANRQCDRSLIKFGELGLADGEGTPHTLLVFMKYTQGSSQNMQVPHILRRPRKPPCRVLLVRRDLLVLLGRPRKFPNRPNPYGCPVGKFCSGLSGIWRYTGSICGLDHSMEQVVIKVLLKGIPRANHRKCLNVSRLKTLPGVDFRVALQDDLQPPMAPHQPGAH